MKARCDRLDPIPTQLWARACLSSWREACCGIIDSVAFHLSEIFRKIFPRCLPGSWSYENSPGKPMMLITGTIGGSEKISLIAAHAIATTQQTQHRWSRWVFRLLVPFPERTWVILEKLAMSPARRCVPWQPHQNCTRFSSSVKFDIASPRILII